MGTVSLIGLVVLAAAFAYGVYQWATRNKRKDGARDDATDALYREDGAPHGKPSQRPKD